MIKIVNLTKRYYNTPILNKLNLELANTGFYIVKGKNGSGKTTLLNLLSGLDKPTSGEIFVDGENIALKSEQELSNYRETSISYIFQQASLFENMSVKGNIDIVGKTINYEKIVTALGLNSILDKKVAKLSGEEKALVVIARGLMKDARIILIDDVTGLTSEDSKRKVYDLLTVLSKTRLVVAVTHDEFIMNTYGDYLLSLKSGVVSEMIEKTFLLESSADIEPHRNSFKPLAFSFKNFFTNKRKLIFSVLLLSIALLAGLLSGSLLNVDYDRAHAEALLRDGYDDIVFTKEGGFTEEDVIELTREVSKVSKGTSVNIQNRLVNFAIPGGSSGSDFYSYRPSNIEFYGVSECPKLLVGSTPEYENEIVINSYLADLFIKVGVGDSKSSYYKPKNYEELINDRHEVNIGGLPFVVTGVSSINTKKFDSLKSTSNEALQSMLVSYLEHNANRVYVKEESIKLFEDYKPALDSNYYIVHKTGYMEVDSKGKEAWVKGSELDFAIFDEPVTLKRSGEQVENLEPDEVIVNGIASNVTKENPYNREERILTVYFEHKKTHEVSEPITFHVRGVSEDSKSYMSIEGMRDYLVKPFSISTIGYRADNGEDIVKIFETYGENSPYKVETPYTAQFKKIEDKEKRIVKITLVTAIICTIIAILIFRSYIKESRDIHKRDILILESMGVKDKQVHRLFMIEVITIVFISFLLGVALFFGVRPLASMIVKNVYALEIELLPIVVYHILIAFIFILLLGIIMTFTTTKKLREIPLSALLRAHL